MSKAVTANPGPSPLSAARNLVGSALGPFLALLTVVALFWIGDSFRVRGGSFTSLANFQTVCVHASTVGVAALGMMLIIIAGGIDLSAGAGIALTATVMAWFIREDYGPTIAVMAAIATGCLAGLVNGALIGALRVVPFIITLGTMTLFQGVARIIAGDIPVRAHGKVPDWIVSLQNPYPEPPGLLVSPGVWMTLALAGVVGFLLRYTIFGRHVFALGSSEATTRLCGISVPRTRVAVYTLAGLFVGVAGLFQFSVLEEGDPTSGVGKELRIIAAVVIGGGSLSGGRGSVLGTLSGAAMMAVIDNGCTILGVPDPFQDLIIGAIIIAAVTLDQFRQRRLIT
jgi:ribose/xylose/arabinose/galactoside ABC-type transport system permease subunit